MNNIKNFLMVTMFLATLGGASFAQAEGYIVRFKTTEEAKSFLAGSSYQAEVLNSDMNIYLVTPSSRSVNAFASLKADKRVKYAQKDHAVQLRNAVTPNDPEFAKQWGLKNTTKVGADIGATEAWALGTAGKTNDGSDIVVAVVDGGVELAHSDLKENIWKNSNEIAGNGIDDDGNGYIDDINGWNAYNNSGNIANNNHGTHVAGIISAKGDNELQVSGVNWNAKIMAVNGSSGTTSVVIKAYTYVLKQKQLWISSNGQKGANVVATNSSFGVDYGKCETGDFPVWNVMYEQMGKAGILSAAATANMNSNVDVDGDVPTGCSSEYIFTVTNTKSDDTKYKEAGYGLKMIDIGAPGTDILSTYTGNTTRSLTGTSMATPHVAGAVAFLYSVASPQLSDLIKKDPAAGALTIKKIIMENTDANTSLQGKTVSGGRLNLGKAAQKAYNYVP